MKFNIPLKITKGRFCPELFKPACTVSVLMFSMIVWLLLVMPLAAADFDIPEPNIPPDWLIEQSFSDGKLDVRGMQLQKGSIYVAASQVSVRNMDVLNGNIFMGHHEVGRQGIHLIQDVTTVRGPLRFLVYRDSQLTRKSDGSKVHFDGVVFSRKELTYGGINHLLYAAESQQQAYHFPDTNSRELVRLPEGSPLYQNPAYLKKLGYTNYLELPIEQLYQQALAGDAKAQFIYGLYWQALSWLDGGADEVRKQLLVFERAAAGGNHDAAFMAGSVYKELGEFETALPYLETAALAGIPIAQYKLAMMLVNGVAVAKDERRALQLFRDSAFQGLSLAQFDYGLMLYRGEGVVPNQQEGLRYMILSALSGNQRAADLLKEAGCGEVVPALLDGGCLEA